MTIETKYNIGDEVWLIEANKCISGKIVGFRHTYGIGHRYGLLYTGKESVNIQYSIEIPDRIFHAVDIEENRLFPTKEELLKSL